MFVDANLQIILFVRHFFSLFFNFFLKNFFERCFCQRILIRCKQPINLLKFPTNLLLGVALDDVADLNIVEIFDVQTAFEACRNLFHIVFETFQ